ncbi:hypothetical protein [Salipiger mucosus]|nr:hypothetical protein [Salipiger mucosus]
MTERRYETWEQSEWIADALEEIGVRARTGKARFYSECAGLAVDVDHYGGSATIPQVARKYYHPVTKQLGDWHRQHKAEMTLHMMTLSALPEKLHVGVAHEQVRDALSMSRTELSALIRRLRDDGWSAEGFEIVLVREEHALSEHDDTGDWMDYAHYHLIMRAPRGPGTRERLKAFAARVKALWTRVLTRLWRRFEGLFPRNRGPREAYVNTQQVRQLDRLRSYLAKAPRVPRDAGKEAVQWVHRVIENRDQLVATLAFKDYRRRRAAEPKRPRRVNPVARDTAGDRYFRVVSPTTDTNTRMLAWRRSLAPDGDLHAWLRPRAANIYAWATHEDPRYRARLSIDQDVLDAVCDILGKERVTTSSVPLRRRPGPAMDHDILHGPQRDFVVLSRGDPPPF